MLMRFAIILAGLAATPVQAQMICPKPLMQLAYDDITTVRDGVAQVENAAVSGHTDRPTYSIIVQRKVQDLFSNLEQNGKIAVAQNFFSMLCQVIASSTTLSDAQKLDYLFRTENIIAFIGGHPIPTVPKARSGCSPQKDAVLAPVRNIFRALQELNFPLYMEQWSKNAIQRTRRSVRKIDDIAEKRQSDFQSKYISISVLHISPQVVFADDLKAHIENKYSAEFFLKNGKKIMEKDIRERYTLECINGATWKVRENDDYIEIGEIYFQ